jgi:hypothetical protein
MKESFDRNRGPIRPNATSESDSAAGTEARVLSVSPAERTGAHSSEHRLDDASRNTPKARCPSHWTLRQRLEHYSIADPSSGCILWVGSAGKNGYGMLNWQNQPWLAHRLAWIEVHGHIPSGMNVLHRCDVRACINPAHLFLGTTADNMRDRREKERIRGRLSNGAFAAIQNATGSPREIAARYGVPEGVVCKIKHDQLAAALKLPQPPIHISKSDKLLATMEQLQSTLQEVLQAMAEKAE